MKGYPEYKDSGAVWLGKVPSHWKTIPTKRFFRLIAEPAPANNDFELLSVYTDIGVKPRKELKQKGNKASTTDGYWLVNKGDIVVNKLLAWMGAVGHSEYFGVTSPAYDILRPTQPFNTKFYHYLFRSKMAQQEFKRWSKGIMEMRLRLYFDQLGQIIMPFPPEDEIEKIVTYLDHKTTRIDNLISEKQNFIKLLKEKRKALISHVVTKGLDPNVKMKESGIEWIRDVPEHWEVKPLKSVGSILSGYAFDSTSFIDKGITVLKISNVQTLTLDWSDKSYVDEHLFKSLKRFAVLDGDIVFALTRPIISTGIKAAIANIGSKKVLLNQRNACFRMFQDYLKTFFYHVLFSQYFIAQFENSIDGTGQQPNISPVDIGNIKVFCPPFYEQEDISNFLDSELSRIDALLSEVNQSIELLKEYRTALISAAVTGKIDVRDHAK